MKKKLLVVLLLSLSMGMVACNHSSDVNAEQTISEIEEEVISEDEEVNEELAAEKVSQGIELMFTDGATALSLFEEAAALGNEEAIFLAGYMLDRCYDYSGQRDYEKAREYYEMIEDRNPYAMISLGYLYLKGWGG